MRRRLALPGPRNWISRIVEEVDDGLSCVLVLPRSLDEAAADLLLAEITGPLDAIEPPSPAAPDTSLVEHLVEAVGAEGWDPGIDLHGALVRWDVISGKTLLIRAWESSVEQVSRFVVQLSAALHAQGASPVDRPRFIIATRLENVGPGALEALDTLTVRIHWWWGCVTPLDTAVYATVRRPPRLDDVAVETCVEVAGWDLEVVDLLFAEWDGAPAALAGVLRAAASGTGEPGVALGTVASTRPGRDHYEKWDAGLIDKWGTSLRCAPRRWACDERDLERLVWRAQNRVLMPLIDDQRERLEAIVRARVPADSLRTIMRSGQAADILEIGDIWYATWSRPGSVPAYERKHVERLWRARNALAHRKCLTASDLSGLTAVFAGANRPRDGMGRNGMGRNGRSD